MTGLSREEMNRNRIRAIFALRENPNGYEFRHTAIIDDDGRRCSLGVIAEEFMIPVNPGADNEHVYEELNLLLGSMQTAAVWVANDSMSTYEQVADHLEKMWFPYGTADC